MGFLAILFYYVLVPLFILGIAINIHEFGHFIIARIFGMRVEAYSFFGLGPRIWGVKWGNTDYRISAIPLGAYVKLYGDESNVGLEGADDKDQAVPESELYELRPRWQKFLVMLGGPFMNIVLALTVPFIAALAFGVPSIPAPVIGAVEENGAAAVAGIKPGDRIISFNGVENATWQQITIEAGINPEKSLPLAVIRDGQRIALQVTPKRVPMLGGQEGGDIQVDPLMPVIIGNVEANAPAQEAGLQSNDRILKINGIDLQSSQHMRTLVQQYKAEPLKLSIDRNGQTFDANLTVRKLADGTERIGIGFKQFLEPATVSTAAAHAANVNILTLQTIGTVLGQVFSGQRSARDAGISGPVGIFQQSAEATQALGWEGVFIILSGISLSLGVFNLLPIPMLDGGQILVLAIEKVMSWFGKTLSMVAKERIQLTGLAVILLLMVFVFFLDFSRIAANFSSKESPPPANSANSNANSNSK